MEKNNNIRYRDEQNLSTPTAIYGKFCAASMVNLMKKSRSLFQFIVEITDFFPKKKILHI